MLVACFYYLLGANADSLFAPLYDAPMFLSRTKRRATNVQ